MGWTVWGSRSRRRLIRVFGVLPDSVVHRGGGASLVRVKIADVVFDYNPKTEEFYDRGRFGIGAWKKAKDYQAMFQNIRRRSPEVK